MRLVLASASPRRAELLRAAGYTCDILGVDVDERIRGGEPAAIYVRRLAAEKSAAAMAIIGESTAGLKSCATDVVVPAAGRKSSATDVVGPAAGRTSSAADIIILGADTAVVVDDEILGKPRDERDAERMLRLISGRAHAVMTGISLRRGAYEIGRVVTTRVEFAALTREDISWYLATGEGRDKAGAYGIQGLASRFVTSIHGSYSNVVGLPVAAVHELLGDIASGSASDYSGSASFPRKSL
jgi:septum formation protein